MKKEDTTVVICSAGMGTRLGIGSTKALIQIEGKPLIIRQLELLDEYDDIRIVLGYQAEQVMKVVNDYRKDIMFAFNHDYKNTGVATSLIKGAYNSRKYVVSIDGDLVLNPSEFYEFMNFDGECIAVDEERTDEPVGIQIFNGNVTNFCRNSGYEWTGLAKIKQSNLILHCSHTYEILENLLPLPYIRVGSCDIDTQNDYDKAVNWVKNGYKWKE